MAKKAPKSIGEQLPPAIIYREDIEEIYKILSDLSKDVTIEADGYIFDNMDDLFSHHKTIINELEMYILNPYVSINFKYKTRIYINDYTNEQVGAYEKIKYVVKKRKNWLHWILNNPSASFVFIVSSLALSVLFFRTKILFYLNVGVLFIVVAITLSAYSLFVGPKKYSQIVLAYKKDKELSFIKRNKDALIIAAIGILASAIMTYISISKS